MAVVDLMSVIDTTQEMLDVLTDARTIVIGPRLGEASVIGPHLGEETLTAPEMPT